MLAEDWEVVEPVPHKDEALYQLTIPYWDENNQLQLLKL